MKGAPTFNRAVLAELFSTFLFALALCTTVLLFEKIFRIMKLAQGAATLDVVKLIIYILPSFLLLGIPMSLLVSVLIVYGRMTMDHETTVLMVSGAPFSWVARPAAVFGAICFIASLFVSLHLFPMSNSLFRQTLYKALQKSVDIEEGVFYDRFPDLMVFAKRKLSKRSYGDLMVYNTRNEDEPVLITARTGELFLDPDKEKFQFLFEDGDIHLSSAGDRYIFMNFGRYFMEFDLGSVPDLRNGREAMTVRQLWLKGHDSASPDALKYRIEFHKRFSLPLACLLLGFLAAPLATLVGRSGRLGGFGIALAVMAGYYTLLVLAENMARSGAVEPWISMWIPDAALGVMAALFGWLRSGR